VDLKYTNRELFNSSTQWNPGWEGIRFIVPVEAFVPRTSVHLVFRERGTHGYVCALSTGAVAALRDAPLIGPAAPRSPRCDLAHL